MPNALIAMSGGVDSSVAAFLMQQRGFTCAGVTMKLFDAEEPDALHKKSCCSLSDVNDARDVAFRLGIPHYTLNLKDEFEHDVIKKFISTYERGGTPNPCIDCNRFIKFNTLLYRARQLEFDTLVTGHYARIVKSNGRFLLKKGLDTNKDQSYVLYMMTQAQLAATVFPLGDFTKEEVRNIAEEHGFINAGKQDSQDICFVPNGDYAGFMESRRGKQYPSGDIRDLSGKKIGVHNGIVRYTIGQRRGLGISASVPLYVQSKSMQTNTITLGPKSSLYSTSLTADNMNLIACGNLNAPLRVSVKTRYLQKEQSAIAEQTGTDSFRIDFDHPQAAITSGQAAVMYNGDLVIGGGTIR